MNLTRIIYVTPLYHLSGEPSLSAPLQYHHHLHYHRFDFHLQDFRSSQGTYMEASTHLPILSPSHTKKSTMEIFSY